MEKEGSGVVENKLKYSRVYLAGPMDLDRQAGREWREHISTYLNDYNIIILNPYKKPIANGFGLEDDESHRQVQLATIEKNYDQVSRLMKCVRQVDLRMVDYADFLIVNLALDKRPCGTWEEIFTANREKKPILIKCEDKSKIPPWLFAVLPHELFFENWYDVMSYIDHIDKGLDTNYLGRWVFFDMEEDINRIANSV